jgi:enoyl-CoA hydratase/carnithine racemase
LGEFCGSGGKKGLDEKERGMEEVIDEVRDRVGYITLNRPEQRNAINKNMAEGIFEALDNVKNNPDVWVCLITGNGKDFSTGHDLTWTSPEIPWKSRLALKLAREGPQRIYTIIS